MCGVNGIYAFHYAAEPIDAAELIRTRDHMTARGPDGCGAWIASDRRIALAHRRLAIIELSDAGAQPMASADGALVVSFNGEIYNYKSLRAELETTGAVFTTGSDTEVLLHLYAARGERMVEELRGMFAFALWDGRARTLLLARDPYGIKPLYYSDDGWTCRFASQVKALQAGGAISREPDPAGAVGFYLFGSVVEPFTMVRAIRAVPAGATVRIDGAGAGAPRAYHSIAHCYSASAAAPCDADSVIAALRDSMRAHLVSDVPVGAFLSSGVDSGALVGLMRDAGAQAIKTVTIGFAEFQGRPEDETRQAAAVAALYGAQHTTRIVTRAEFEADLPRIAAAMDQPSIDGVNTWFVSKAARELGLKVAISGLGGDELFGGYPSFRDVPAWVRRFNLPSRVPYLGAALRRLGARTAARLGANPKAAGLVEYGGTYPGAYLLRRGLYMPWELGAVLDRDVIRDGLRRLAPLAALGRALEPDPGDAFARVATLEAVQYMRNQLLRDTDWASMAHSLEVRTPLVDSALLAVAARARAAILREGKHILARAPSTPLPDAVVNHAKTGFVTPVAAWIGAAATKCGKPAAAPEPWARAWSRVVAKQFEEAQP